MKNKLILIPVISLALLPPIGMWLPLNNSIAWHWLVTCVGFLGLYSCFLNISKYVKILSVICFINMFFSTAPFISQLAYIEVVGCIYLYWLCKQIDDWQLVFRALWTVFALNVILLVVQTIHKDSFLNFGFYESSCRGVVGNMMQLKSYMIVLVALLIQRKPLSEKATKNLTWVLICIGIWYFYSHHALYKMTFRWPVWSETYRLALQHPWIGWGVGQFKVIFPSLSDLSHTTARTEGMWLTAHNDFLQVMFEIGIPGFLVFMAYIVSLLSKCKGALLLGTCMILYTMMVHFPMRSTQIVPLLILFVAYIERKKHASSISSRDSQPSTWTS